MVKSVAHLYGDPMRVELKGIRKVFDQRAVLDAVTMTVEPGQVVAVLGANGAGKTTLLRLLAGILGPTRGEVLFDGEVFKRGRLDLRQRLCFLPDYPAVFEHWTVLQHIGMVLRLYGEGSKEGLEDKVMDLLKGFDLLAVAESPFMILSRGQRYKAALVAMIAANPEIWLLDEPFASGMDPHGINEFKGRAREAAQAGRTIFYTTQIVEAAERFSNLICVLHEGKVHALENTEKLRASPTGTGSSLDHIFETLREESQA